jgi:putative ABC transport system permease protein
MSLIKIAWRSIRQRALASGMTAFAMGLGVALVVTVLVIHSVIEQSFTRGTLGCNFIVGGKGSQYQLVLNSIFHVEKPLGNIPYKYIEELQNRYSMILETMVPMCMGHDYKTYPAIATTQDYFDKLTYKSGDKFTFAKGRNFQDENFYEAVIGSKAADWLNLKLDDEISPVASGGAEGKDPHGHHDFKIVGILAPTGTANDRAVFVNIEGFWRSPAHNANAAADPAKSAEKRDSKSAPNIYEKYFQKILETAGIKAGSHGDAHADEHAEHAEPDLSFMPLVALLPDPLYIPLLAPEFGREHVNREVSAILVCTKSESIDPAKVALTAKISALMELEINKGPVAQAANPGRVLNTLLETMVGKIQMILLILAVLVVVEAGIGIMVSMYNSMSDRKHDIAIMRALGASRLTVMTIILLESILLALGGGLGGMLVGHGMVGAMSSVIAEQSGVFISGLDFRPVELILIPGLIALATLVGYLPAMYAYKTDVAKSLMAGT